MCLATQGTAQAVQAFRDPAPGKRRHIMLSPIKSQAARCLVSTRLRAAIIGTEEGTRTPTAFRPLPPQGSVSTNSTTSAKLNRLAVCLRPPAPPWEYPHQQLNQLLPAEEYHHAALQLQLFAPSLPECWASPDRHCPWSAPLHSRPAQDW